MEANLGSLLHKDVVAKTQAVTNNGLNALRTAGAATSSIVASLGDITKLGLNKTAANPVWITAIAGLGGLVTGVKSVKNILKSVSTMMVPTQDLKLGWLPHGIMGILQGGLFFGLTSAFFGKHNLFTEISDGKPVVRMKTLAGAAIAPFGLSVLMNLAKATSILRKIPILGPALQEICETIFGAGREMTVGTDSNPQASAAGAPALGR
ncbi:MAG: hypothetical protein O2962_05840 [Cyanobacteria bacterium]|nr:hypothetical protein [Cyanobacteriota bacterium]